jgi:site-specific DNA-cytosine methylase
VIPVVSLFSGSGGLDLGFRQQGFVPVLALDSKQVAVDTYNLNHPEQHRKALDDEVGYVRDVMGNYVFSESNRIPMRLEYEPDTAIMLGN